MADDLRAGVARQAMGERHGQKEKLRGENGGEGEREKKRDIIGNVNGGGNRNWNAINAADVRDVNVKDKRLRGLLGESFCYFHLTVRVLGD